MNNFSAIDAQNDISPLVKMSSDEQTGWEAIAESEQNEQRHNEIVFEPEMPHEASWSQ